VNFFERNRHYIALHGVIFLWGFTGILGRLITISAVSIVWWRVLIAFFGLVAFMLVTKRSFQTNLRNRLKYLGTGVIVALHWVLFFQALKVSNVSVTLTTLASTSLFVAFIEPFVFKRRIKPYEIILGLLTIAGLALIFNVETQYKLGIIYSLGSALCAGIFGTLNGLFVQNGRPTLIALHEMIGGVVALSILFLISGDFSLQMPVPIDWLWLLILGLICTSMAQVISINVMKYLSPFTVTISINMEPIYAIIFALLIFREEEYMSPWFYAGAIVILSMILLNSLIKKRERVKSPGTIEASI